MSLSLSIPALARVLLGQLTPDPPVYIATRDGRDHWADRALDELICDFEPPKDIPPLPEESERVLALYADAPAGIRHSELPAGTRGLAHGVVLEPKVIEGSVYRTASTGDWGKGTAEAERRQKGFVSLATQLGVHRFQILGDIIYPVAPTRLDDSRLESQLSSIVAALGPIGADVPMPFGNHDWANLSTHDVEPEGIRTLMEHAERDPVLLAPARYWAQEIHLNGGAGPKILEIYLDNEFLHEDPRQLKWLDDLLANHGCDRVKIKMHRSFLSGGLHGKNSKLEEHLAPRINASRGVVSVEAAHDHHNEEIVHPQLRAPVSISGTAGESRPFEPLPSTQFGTSRPALRVVDEDGTRETVRWFDLRGRELYRAHYEPDAFGWIRGAAAGAASALPDRTSVAA